MDGTHAMTVQPVRGMSPSAMNFPNGSYGIFRDRNRSPVMMSALNGAQPNDHYTFRPPSPPHIHIPQGPENATYVLNRPALSDYSDEEEEILRRVAAATSPTGPMGEWKYELRRKAQAVFPFLHLGPSSCARDIEALRAQGITMLLVIRNNMMGNVLSGQKASKELGIELVNIDVAGYQELISVFPRVIKVINDHLITSYQQMARNDDEECGRKVWGKILVFCESGNERSAGVVAAYVMKMFGLTMTTAVQFVQSRRFCVAYDDGLKHVLKAYDDILFAQRMVSAANSARLRQTFPPAKRSREVEDEDIDMGVGMQQLEDMERFVGRSTFRPFNDVD